MASNAGKITALYCRLSEQDRNRDESVSIENQKILLSRFAKENGFTNTRFYVDDGEKSWDFEKRPALNELIAAVEAGEVGIFIVKDQDRFGRDVMGGAIFRAKFELYGVRFIAPGDNLDTAKSNDVDKFMTYFRDMAGEFLLTKQSQKMRAVNRMRATQGKALGRVAQYGYVLDEKDRSIWHIDEAAADIVREVFQLYLSGMICAEICREFSNRGIPTPDNHMRGIGYTVPWNNGTVYKMLDDVAYIGTYIGYKWTTPSYKIQKKTIRSEDEWVVIENHHPAIVDKEIFEAVQRIRKSKRRTRKTYGETSFLNGLSFCSDCGKPMAYYRHETYPNLICTQYRQGNVFGERKCSRHGIRVGDLEVLVQQRIQETVKYALEKPEEFALQVQKQSNKEAQKSLKKKVTELRKAETRMAELTKLKVRTYEDNVSGKLDDDTYLEIVTAHREEQDALSITVESLKSEVAELECATANVKGFIKLAEAYGGEVTEAEVLTEEIAKIFVDRIIVHEATHDGGRRHRKNYRQEVEIYLSYLGKFKV